MIDTADRELEVATLEVGIICEEILECNGGRLPADIARDCYQDEASRDGVFTFAEKDALLGRGSCVQRQAGDRRAW